MAVLCVRGWSLNVWCSSFTSYFEIATLATDNYMGAASISRRTVGEHHPIWDLSIPILILGSLICPLYSVNLIIQWVKTYKTLPFHGKLDNSSQCHGGVVKVLSQRDLTFLPQISKSSVFIRPKMHQCCQFGENLSSTLRYLRGTQGRTHRQETTPPVTPHVVEV